MTPFFGKTCAQRQHTETGSLPRESWMGNAEVKGFAPSKLRADQMRLRSTADISAEDVTALDFGNGVVALACADGSVKLVSANRTLVTLRHPFVASSGATEPERVLQLLLVPPKRFKGLAGGLAVVYSTYIELYDRPDEQPAGDDELCVPQARTVLMPEYTRATCACLPYTRATCACLPGKRFLFVGTSQGTVIVLNLREAQWCSYEVPRLVWRTSPVTALVMKPRDESQLLIAYGTGHLKTFHTTTRKEHRNYEHAGETGGADSKLTFRGPVRAAVWDPTGEWIAAGFQNGDVVLWKRRAHTAPAQVIGTVVPWDPDRNAAELRRPIMSLHWPRFEALLVAGGNPDSSGGGLFLLRRMPSGLLAPSEQLLVSPSRERLLVKTVLWHGDSNVPRKESIGKAEAAAPGQAAAAVAPTSVGVVLLAAVGKSAPAFFYPNSLNPGMRTLPSGPQYVLPFLQEDGLSCLHASSVVFPRLLAEAQHALENFNSAAPTPDSSGNSCESLWPVSKREPAASSSSGQPRLLLAGSANGWASLWDASQLDRLRLLGKVQVAGLWELAKSLRLLTKLTVDRHNPIRNASTEAEQPDGQENAQQPAGNQKRAKEKEKPAASPKKTKKGKSPKKNKKAEKEAEKEAAAKKNKKAGKEAEKEAAAQQASDFFAAADAAAAKQPAAAEKPVKHKRGKSLFRWGRKKNSASSDSLKSLPSQSSSSTQPDPPAELDDEASLPAQPDPPAELDDEPSPTQPDPPAELEGEASSLAAEDDADADNDRVLAEMLAAQADATAPDNQTDTASETSAALPRSTSTGSSSSHSDLAGKVDKMDLSAPASISSVDVVSVSFLSKQVRVLLADQQGRVIVGKLGGKRKESIAPVALSTAAATGTASGALRDLEVSRAFQLPARVASVEIDETLDRAALADRAGNLFLTSVSTGKQIACHHLPCPAQTIHFSRQSIAADLYSSSTSSAAPTRLSLLYVCLQDGSWLSFHAHDGTQQVTIAPAPPSRGQKILSNFTKKKGEKQQLPNSGQVLLLQTIDATGRPVSDASFAPSSSSSSSSKPSKDQLKEADSPPSTGSFLVVAAASSLALLRCEIDPPEKPYSRDKDSVSAEPKPAIPTPLAHVQFESPLVAACLISSPNALLQSNTLLPPSSSPPKPASQPKPEESVPSSSAIPLSDPALWGDFNKKLAEKGESLKNLIDCDTDFELLLQTMWYEEKQVGAILEMIKVTKANQAASSSSSSAASSTFSASAYNTPGQAEKFPAEKFPLPAIYSSSQALEELRQVQGSCVLVLNQAGRVSAFALMDLSPLGNWELADLHQAHDDDRDLDKSVDDEVDRKKKEAKAENTAKGKKTKHGLSLMPGRMAISADGCLFLPALSSQRLLRLSLFSELCYGLDLPSGYEALQAAFSVSGPKEVTEETTAEISPAKNLGLFGKALFEGVSNLPVPFAITKSQAGPAPTTQTSSTSQTTPPKSGGLFGVKAFFEGVGSTIAAPFAGVGSTMAAPFALSKKQRPQTASAAARTVEGSPRKGGAPAGLEGVQNFFDNFISQVGSIAGPDSLENQLAPLRSDVKVRIHNMSGGGPGSQPQSLSQETSPGPTPQTSSNSKSLQEAIDKKRQNDRDRAALLEKYGRKKPDDDGDKVAQLQGEVSGTAQLMGSNVNKARENLELAQQVQDKSEMLAQNAAQFADLAKKMRDENERASRTAVRQQWAPSNASKWTAVLNPTS
eukprot:g40599.t1